MANDIPLATRTRKGLMGPKDKIVNDATGNVGIGTLEPEAPLHISKQTFVSGSSIHADLILENPGPAPGNARFFLKSSVNNRDWEFFAAASDGSFGIYDGVAAARRMTIDIEGRIGMGVSSPICGLQVRSGAATVDGQDAVAARFSVGGADKALLLGSLNGNAPFVAASSGYPLSLRTSGENRLHIANSGNVGINDSTPEEKLDVLGNIRAQGDISVVRSIPSDYWQTGVLHLPYGTMGSAGAYNVSITANGYRNTSNQWTSLGVQGSTAAAQIDLDTQTGDIDFRVATDHPAGSASSVPSKMILKGNGNLGIGATPANKLTVSGDTNITGSLGVGVVSPSEKLHVAGNGLFSGTLSSGGTTELANLSFRFVSSGSINYIQSGDSTDTGGNFRKLVFAPWFTTIPYLAINDGGNIGIGTTDSEAGLHIYKEVAGDDVEDQLILETYRTDFSLNPGGNAIVFRNLDSNNEINYAKIKAITVNDVDYGYNNESTTNFIFEMTKNKVPTENVIFTGDGRVGFGIMNPSEKLDVNGNGNFSGNITAGGTITALSDESLKTNIKTISNGLDKVLKMRGVSFNWSEASDNRDHIGVIAQEIEKISPELVVNAHGKKSVAYGNIVAILIEAIKEQNIEISNLRSMIKK